MKKSFFSFSTEKSGLKVLPPWYRTWWMYSIYGIIVITVVFVLSRAVISSDLTVKTVRRK